MNLKKEEKKGVLGKYAFGLIPNFMEKMIPSITVIT